MNAMSPQLASRSTLESIENFPSFERAAPFLEKIIVEHGYKSIADAGGGANPILDASFIERNKIDYFVLDKSTAELKKTRASCTTIEVSVTGDGDEFRRATAGRKFDLIISHMLLEHLDDPLQAHRNFFDALNRGGRCVHIYPSPNNLPLALNRLLPEAVSSRLLKLAQPGRDLGGASRKFKAYYRMCGAPSLRLAATFEKLGYAIVQHTGYVGHTYYERCEPAAALERRLRKIILKFQWPLTCGCLLILQKPG
jgi:SAM-dependent methyltransferase